MEIPLEELENLFTSYLASPEVQKVADVIVKRLGRDLEPFDIWYDGFKTRTAIPAEFLDKEARSRYPNPKAVQQDLPRILMNLGFTRERAASIAGMIQVDPARGSGHAWGAETRELKSLLRTRIFAEGMDYKGYNIAIHEFGHNVEQTIVCMMLINTCCMVFPIPLLQRLSHSCSRRMIWPCLESGIITYNRSITTTWIISGNCTRSWVYRLWT
jgi:hypothetical protein